MICKCIQIIGGAGVGKTRTLINEACRLIEDELLRPDDLGMVSFTRAAAREALGRLEAIMGAEYPWVRTIHSVAYRSLGLSRGDIAEPRPEGAEPDFDMAIRAWHHRVRLGGPETIERAAEMPADRLWRFIAEYERMKRLEGVMDYTDLLARFAGIRFSERGDWEEVEPEGEQPPPMVWFFDEQQDASPLLWRACMRLCRTAVRAYFCGDPFQSIYGWAGADVRSFMESVDYHERRILNLSYRVPSRLLLLGEAILEHCPDYFDRGMRAHREGGDIHIAPALPMNVMDDSDDVMVIARTNLAAQGLGAELTKNGIPWLALSGTSGWFSGVENVRSPWQAPARNAAYMALMRLAGGLPATRGEWKALLQYLPSRVDGVWMIARGAKQRDDWPEYVDQNYLQGVCHPSFWQWVQSGDWAQHCEFGEPWLAAYRRYGTERIEQPRVRVGTIHGAKGGEADVVVLDTARGRRGLCDSEESRIWYVGVTRARHVLYAIDRAHRSSEVISFLRSSIV